MWPEPDRPPGGSPTADPLRVAVLSSVFPNPRQPHHGLFVRRRVESLPAGIEARVVVPWPWFPGAARLRAGSRPRPPRRERQGRLVVEHPPFPSVPGILKSLDGVALFLALLPVMRRLRRDFPFRVIDAHFVYPEGVAAVLLGRALGVPVVLTLRGVLAQVADRRLRRVQATFALRRADRVIAVSESLRRLAAELGRDPARVRVVPNAVDPRAFPLLDRATARRALGLSAAGPFLLFVGTPVRRKGLHLVVEALPALAERWPGIRLLVVGGAGAEGNELPALARRVRQLELAGRVVFAGPRPPDELPSWYAAADLFVLPSELEGSCNALLEAIASGTPAVATGAGEAAEVMAGSGGGVLVPRRTCEALGVAIAEALGRSWDREAMRAWVLRRTWSAVGEAVAEELWLAVGAEAPVAAPAGWRRAG